MMNIVRRRADRNAKRCAFTGYRPQKMPFGFDETDPRCIEFKARLFATIEYLIGKGYSHFLSGGALGMDLFAAEAVLELRKKYPWIVLEMVSPFDGQSDRWEAEDKIRHAILFAEADIITATGHKFDNTCLFRRNRYLVNNADLVLAAFDGQPGGTAMVVDYAQKMDVPVCLIAPTVKLLSEVC